MEYAALGFAALFLVTFLGVPLGYSMLGIGIIGFTFERGVMPALSMANQQILDLGTNYDFSVLPMFLLMGAFVHRANLSEELYRACNAWVGHRRGGLAMATIGACGGFAAVCGSSMATAAIMAKIAIPQMRRFKYSDSLGAASIAAGGTLGILIPPSVPMVVYGIITQTDIGKLFIAGVVPGLVMIAAYLSAIALSVRIDPEAGPRGPRASWADRWKFLGQVWGVVALFVLVLGGIYIGVFTPTEAAGIGSAGGFLFALLRGKLNWRALLSCLLEAGMTTTSIFVVAFGALVFSNFLTLTGMMSELIDAIQQASLHPTVVILIICLVYIVLGCVFESLGMMLLTVPVFFPVIQSLGLDPIWFGIIVVIVVEIALITPPVGMNVFVVRGVAPDIPLGTIFRGVTPFVVVSAAVLILIVFFPEIALFLPNLM